MQIPTVDLAALVLSELASQVVSLSDPVPEDHEVKAGWFALGLFIAMILAVALLSKSLVTRLRNAEKAEQAGRYAPLGRPRPAAETEEDEASDVSEPAEERGADGPEAAADGEDKPSV